jgi:hypothetical protein
MSLILKSLISVFSYQINIDTVRWGSRVNRSLGHPPVTEEERTLILPYQYPDNVRSLDNKICNSPEASSVSILTF